MVLKLEAIRQVAKNLNFIFSVSEDYLDTRKAMLNISDCSEQCF